MKENNLLYYLLPKFSAKISLKLRKIKFGELLLLKISNNVSSLHVVTMNNNTVEITKKIFGLIIFTNCF